MKQMDEVKQMAFMLNETEEDFIRRAISNELKKAKIAFNDYVTVDENEYNYTIKSSHIDRFSKILNFHDIPYRFETKNGNTILFAKLRKDDFLFLYENMDLFEEDVKIPIESFEEMPDENLVKLFKKLYNNNGFSY
jgi:hypothetical protein